jgi:hypothetical protein
MTWARQAGTKFAQVLNCAQHRVRGRAAAARRGRQHAPAHACLSNDHSMQRAHAGWHRVAAAKLACAQRTIPPLAPCPYPPRCCECHTVMIPASDLRRQLAGYSSVWQCTAKKAGRSSDMPLTSLLFRACPERVCVKTLAHAWSYTDVLAWIGSHRPHQVV